MTARIRFAILVMIALAAPATLQASPITYDFAGTLNQPISGLSQFIGTFTIDSNPNVPLMTPGGGGTAIGEQGTDVSLVVNLGGQTIHYANTTQNPENAQFSASAGAGGGLVLGAPLSVDISVAGGVSANSPIEFALTLSRPGTDFNPAELANLALPSYTSTIWVTEFSGGQMPQQIQGTLTSIEQVPAPEPGMLTIFGLMALAGMAHRLCRKVGRKERALQAPGRNSYSRPA